MIRPPSERPGHLGKPGYSTTVGPKSRARFDTAFCKPLSEAGDGWPIWD